MTYEIKCEKCGRTIYGYVGIVHTAEKRESTETWCEKCCEDHGMYKCDGCGEEFVEEYRMPRIDGCLFCVPCARDQVPRHFDWTPMFN